MMKKTLYLLVLLFLFVGCADETATQPTIAPTSYDWQSNHSPIPAQITGIDRQGENNVQNGFECTDTGFYAMCDGWLLYCDHGSDEIIKLCGRPDCTHSDESCNAYFHNGANICLDDGYLYVAVDFSHLVRVDLDGTNRVTLLKAEGFSQTGFNVMESPHIWDGIYSISMGHLDEEGAYIIDGYYATLDTDGKSMTRTEQYVPEYNDGNAYIVHTTEEMDYLWWSWDPVTDEKVYLARTHLWDCPGYYGAEEAWYFDNGILYNMNYEVGIPEPVLDTGLEGYHQLHCFHDLIVISDCRTFEQYWKDEQCEQQNLYFYNWDFEQIGQITMPWLGDQPICGVTPERILLSSSDYKFIPRYYINKSELGTGNIQLHEFIWSEELKDIYDKSNIEIFNPNGAEVYIDYGTWSENDG